MQFHRNCGAEVEAVEMVSIPPPVELYGPKPELVAMVKAGGRSEGSASRVVEASTRGVKGSSGVATVASRQELAGKSEAGSAQPSVSREKIRALLARRGKETSAAPQPRG